MPLSMQGEDDGGDGGGGGGGGGGEADGSGGDGECGDGEGGDGGRPGQKLQVPLQFSTNKGFLHLFDFSVKPRQSTGSASPHGSGEGEGEGGGGGGDRVQSEQLSWQNLSTSEVLHLSTLSMIVTSSSWQNFGSLSSHRREDGDGDGDGGGEAKGEGDGGGGDGGDGGGLGDGGQGGLRGSLITIDHPRCPTTRTCMLPSWSSRRTSPPPHTAGRG